MASHRSRRWKSGSAPEIFTASSQTSECVPARGVQWNLTKCDSPSALTSRIRVNAKALHRPVAARDRAVGHRPHQHVRDLGHQRREIPEGVVRRSRLRHGEVRFRLGRMHQIGKLHRILDEEDRDVVADEVPVALVRVELHRKATNVARGVGRSAFAEHRREPDEDGRLFAGLGEERRARIVLERLCSTRRSRAPRNRGHGRSVRGCVRDRSG